MYKQSLICLALAVGAWVSTPASAAIVSLGYSSKLSNGNTFSATLNWDSAAQKGSNDRFPLSSFALSVNGTSYTSQVSRADASVYESLNNIDELVFLFYINSNATGALAGINMIRLELQDTMNGDMLNGASSLPADLSFLGKQDSTELWVYSNDPFAQPVWSDAVSLTDASQVSTTPPNGVPEPGSLLLASLAGLALMATRRRKPLKA